jgi:hypothetical protein
VGDRIQFGVSNFAEPWGEVNGLSRADVEAMQLAIEAQGHDVGGADGLAGFKTRRAIGRRQDVTGREATCWPEPGLRGELAP